MGNPNWVKGGPSPNPAGRTRSASSRGQDLAREICKQTRDGAELLDRLLEISRQSRDTPMLAREAIAATVWLLERVAGKAPVEVRGRVDHTLTLVASPVAQHAIDALSDEEAARLEDQIRGLLGPAEDAEILE